MAFKVALITGGARGLGHAIAEALLEKGTKVCLADVLKEVGNAAADDLAEKHGADRVIYAQCDVTNQEQFRAAWSECEEKLGAPDLLINNAGVGDEVNWRRTLDINLGGCITGTLLALEKMGKSGGGEGGTVLNVASIAGVKSIPFGPIYSATKHGIVGLTRSLGHPLHCKLTGVKVQCLCPALIDTMFIKESMQTPFSKDVAKVMAEHAGTLEVMKLEVVVAACLQLLDEGTNGAVMVVEPGKEPYNVPSPVGP